MKEVNRPRRIRKGFIGLSIYLSKEDIEKLHLVIDRFEFRTRSVFIRRILISAVNDEDFLNKVFPKYGERV